MAINERSRNKFGKPFRPASQGRRSESCPRWQCSSRLFSEPGEDFQKALDLLPKALEKVWRVPASKKKYLPNDIADLSRLLTRGRSELNIPYWHKAANLSAYLYYFLPWNIIRLGFLFSSLPLPRPKEAGGALPVLLDMGSGPLALPIALWLAKKDWRDLPLQVLALDSAKQPMDAGRDLFYALAELMGEKAWPVQCRAGTAERPLAALQTLSGKNHDEKFYPWLLSEANILNELISKSPTRDEPRKHRDEFGEDEYDDEYGDDDECANSLLGRLLHSWTPVWRGSPGKPLALFVEPGTRLGGDAIMNLRKCALRLGLEPLAPCAHANSCPLLGKTRSKGSQAESWCHFTFSAMSAPQWLKDLSREAGLEKNSLSLSILLLGEEGSAPRSKSDVRVISQPFRVPGLKGEARYGCGASGLRLLENAAWPASGSLVSARIKEPLQKDRKSGAIISEPAQEKRGPEKKR